jgi:tripartite-type tricarboxylate transporter receptor subunit TctC
MATPKAVAFFVVLALAGAWLGVAPVQAGSYPNRPIRLIVPYPPGGGIDPSARILAESLAKTLGRPLYVDNHAGASGRIGTASPRTQRQTATRCFTAAGRRTSFCRRRMATNSDTGRRETSFRSHSWRKLITCFSFHLRFLSILSTS